jgi:hypothetical protein
MAALKATADRTSPDRVKSVPPVAKVCPVRGKPLGRPRIDKLVDRVNPDGPNSPGESIIHCVREGGAYAPASSQRRLGFSGRSSATCTVPTIAPVEPSAASTSRSRRPALSAIRRQNVSAFVRDVGHMKLTEAPPSTLSINTSLKASAGSAYTDACRAGGRTSM